MAKNELQENVRTCTDLVPQDEDEPWFVEQSSAEDASVAIAYALTCRQSGNSQEAAWSARRAYAAVDQFVIHRENIDLKPMGAARRVLAHPLIQAELARQRRDIDELLGAVEEDVRQIAVRFRERAKTEGRIFFGTPS